MGEEGGAGATAPGGAAEPIRGSPAAAPPGSRVGVSAQDQCARAASDSYGETLHFVPAASTRLVLFDRFGANLSTFRPVLKALFRLPG